MRHWFGREQEEGGELGGLRSGEERSISPGAVTEVVGCVVAR